ncbi:MAG: PAS domain S-box protein [Cyanobacteria bacterium J06639_14]
MSLRTAALPLVDLKSAIVQNPLVVSPNTLVSQAIAQMSALHSHDEIPDTADKQLETLHLTVRSSCVVVVEEEHVVGILTERDVVRLSARQEPFNGLQLQQVTSSPVITLRESAFVEVSSALNLLQKHHIRHLCILDDQDQLVGLVTHESLQHIVMLHQLQTEVDIRQQIEARLQATEDRYATLVEAAPAGIFHTNVTGDCTYVNDYWCQITGLTLETALGKGWQQGIHPEDRPKVTAAWCLSTQENRPFQLEYRFQHLDGEVRWVHGKSVASEHGANGQVIGYVGVITDISDRKQAELALKQSELTNHALIEAIPDLLIQMDREGYQRRVAGRSAVHIKYLSESLSGPEVYDVLPRNLAEQRLHYAHQAIASNSLQIYEQVLDGDGTPRYEEIRIAPLNDQEVIVVIRDITDRKRAEVALEASERRFRQLFEATPKISVQGYDQHHKVIYWNDASEELYGYTRAEAIGQTLEDLIIPLEMQSWVNTSLQTWMSGGPAVPAGELSLKHKDGSRVAVYSSHIMLTSPTGEPEMYCVDIDLSELKQTEAALKESEARWQFALEGTGDGVWDWNVQRQTVFYSRQWKTMLGYTDDEVGNHFNNWANLLHPEDKDRCYSDLEKYFEGETSTYYNEHRLRCKDGRYKWVLTRGKVIECTAEGQPLRMIGTHKDISDRKQAETALQNLIAGTAATTGENFFPALVRYIAEALNVSYVVVTEKVEDSLHTLAFWANGALQPLFSYQLANMPCERTLQEGQFYCEDSIQQCFPAAAMLDSMGVNSYLGIALCDVQGNAIGNLCILNPHPIANPQRAEQILRVFAARAAAELARQRASTSLEQLNNELETEVAERTAALCASENQIRSMIEAIPDLLLRVTRDGICLEAVKSRQQADEFLPIQQHLSELLPPALLQQQLHRIEAAITTGNLQVYEHQLLKDGRMAHEEIRISAINPDEVLIIVRDITLRKQVEADLRRYERIVSATVDGISLVDQDYIYRAVNQTYLERTSRTRNEIIGHSVAELNGEEAFLQQIKPEFDRCLAGEIIYYEDWFDYPNMGRRFVSVRYVPYREVDGTISGVLVTTSDMTEHKHADLALQQLAQELAEWRDRYDIAARASGQVLFEYDFATHQETWGPNSEVVLGPTADVLLQRRQENIDNIHPDDRAAFLQVINNNRTTKTPYRVEFRLQNPDGTYRWLEERGMTRFDTQGNAVQVIGYWRDISDRKRVEVELDANRAYYQGIISDQTELICRYLPDGTFTFANDAYCQFFQKAPDELIGHRFTPLMPDEDRDIPSQNVRNLSVDNSVVTYEHRVIAPNGRVAWQQWTERAIFDSDDNFIEFQAVGRDITALKEAEEALRESEQRFRLAIENAPFPIMIHAEDGEVLQINTTWTELTGYTLHDMPTIEAWAERAYGDRAEEMLTHVIFPQYTLQSPQGPGEFTITTEDGNSRIWHFRSAPLGRLPDDRRVVISMAADVTQQRELSGRLNLALESAAIGIWDWDITKNTLVWDERMYELYDKVPDQCTNVYETWFDSLHPDDRTTAEVTSQQALQGEKDYDTEFRVMHPDGSIRFIKANALVQRNAAGEPQRMIGINYDITERKETEVAMKRQLAAIEAAIEGIAILHGDTFLYLNQAHLDLFGYECAEELVGKTWYNLYLPKAVEWFEQEVFPVLEQERAWQGETTAVRSDGSTFAEELSLTLTEDDLLICVCRNIDDRKAAEAAMRRQLAVMEAAVEGISILQGETFLYVNQAKLVMFGYERCEELIGKTWRSMYPPEEIKRYEEEVLPALDRYRSWEGEIIATRKDGSTFIEGLSLTVSEEGLLICVCRDISDRKRTEMQVRSLLNRTQLLNRISSKIRHSLHLDIILQTTVNAIVAELPADICTFAWYYREDSCNIWEIAKEQKKPELLSWLGSHQLEDFPAILDCILQNQPYRVDDLSLVEDESFRAFLARAGVTAYLCLPIHTLGGRVGTLQMGRIAPESSWHIEEIRLLQDIGDQVAIAIHQAHLYEESQAKTKALQQSYQELQETQLQLIQSEKMSSLGQLVAGIAHEINNPMSFIYGNLEPALDYTQSLSNLIRIYQETFPDPPKAIANFIKRADIEYILDDFPKLLASMETGATRIQDIIQSLRTFSRLDRAESRAINLHENIDSTLVILQNRLNGRAGKPEIPVIKNYGDLPLVECYGGLLNQVFMNLLVNAIDAIEERQINAAPDYLGCITITTTVVSDNKVTVAVRDNGLGIPAATQAKIFNPFFTTKPVGVGTGMGLPISYQIVTGNHQGQLRCHSTLGQGTEFIVELWQSLHQSSLEA